MYVYFSNEDEMLAIPEHIPTEAQGAERKWRASRMVPFAGRMVIENMKCGNNGEFMRILVNIPVCR